MKERPSFRRKIEGLEKEKPLGQGIQKRVYPEPGHEEDKVRKVYGPSLKEHLTDAEYDALATAGVRDPTVYSQKRSFYLMKILHFLFPHNIPNRHQATSEPFTTLDERIEGKAFKHPFVIAFTNHAREAQTLARELRALGIFPDTIGKNFVKKEDGTIAYIDELNLTLLSHIFTKQFERKLEKAIASKPDSQDKERALAWFKRFQEIGKP